MAVHMFFIFLTGILYFIVLYCTLYLTISFWYSCSMSIVTMSCRVRLLLQSVPIILFAERLDHLISIGVRSVQNPLSVTDWQAVKHCSREKQFSFVAQVWYLGKQNIVQYLNVKK